MKYVRIDKENGDKEEITRKRALKILSNNYSNPEYVLQESEKLFGDRIFCDFSILEIIR